MYSRVIEPATERIQKAVDLAWRFAQIGGDHHKMWVIDQMLRTLFENEEDYKRWVAEYEEDGEYVWDIGIAP